MEFPIIDNTAEYVEFMKKNFPQKKIGKMPKSEKDLDLTVRIEMENLIEGMIHIIKLGAVPIIIIVLMIVLKIFRKT